MNVGDIYKVSSLKSKFNIISSVPKLNAPNGWKSLLKWIRANLIFENTIKRLGFHLMSFNQNQNPYSTASHWKQQSIE